MSINLKSVAAEAGVSYQTVSHVLGNNPRLAERYNPVTRERIEKAALKLGYHPNIAARSMVLGHFDTVGLLLSKERYRSLLPEDLLNGIEEKLTELRLRLTVHRIPDDQLKDPQIVRHLCRALMVDGLLININSAIPEKMTRLFEKYHIPSIWLNSRQPADAVHPDDERAATEATRFLLDLSHRRIAFVEPDQVTPGTPMHYSLGDRRNGYLAAMRDAGHPPRLIARNESGYPLRSLEGVRPLLTDADRPTAMVVYSDKVAMPLLHACALCGIRVPEDISILTFSHRPLTILGRTTTGMMIPDAEMGRAAVEALLQKIKAPQLPHPVVPTPLTLRRGDTCVPPGQ